MSIGRTRFGGVALVALMAIAAPAMEIWTDCEIVPDAFNDGDSFRIRAADRSEHRIRLYFVDAPETAAATDADARRLREQTAYFGLTSPSNTLAAGQAAAAFTAERCSRPFTVITARATAPGRGREPRIYAFVKTAEGRDLAEWLVASGLARAVGVGRATPEGVRRDEQFERLRDLELAAVIRRAGAWRDSHPDVLVERRAALRAERSELDALRREAHGVEARPPDSIHPNTATEEALRALPGIGPALARRIVEGRPYSGPDDLLRVRGIGQSHLEAFRERLDF